MDTREQTNTILRGAGFVWRKHRNDEEDADRFNLPEYEWFLHDTNDKDAVLTVRQAMERGAQRGQAACAAWLERNPDPKTVSHKVYPTYGRVQAGETFYHDYHGWMVVQEVLPDNRYKQHEVMARYATKSESTGAEEAEKAREAAEETAKKAAEEAAFNHTQAERTRMTAWREEHLAGLVPLDTSLQEPTDQAVRFDTDTFGGPVRFSPFLHMAGYREDYGSSARAWVTPAYADAYFGSWWKGTGEQAFTTLAHYRNGFSTYGSDRYRWAFERLGEARLLTLARQDAPYHFSEQGLWPHGPASLIYRIRVTTEYRGTAYDGYGDPTHADWRERAARGFPVAPLNRWINADEADTAVWPTEADRDEAAAKQQQRNDFLTMMDWS